MRSAALKRIVDLCIALIGLVVLSPLLALIAIAVRLFDRGPVLFRQERIGLRFKPFLMYKFRTMVPEADGAGSSLTIGDDRRVTRLGRILRQTKLDELPQLLNVLDGDMSLVGPRPELRRYVQIYRLDYNEILSVRPGITDLASILYRDESRLLGESGEPEAFYVDKILPDKIRLGKEYVRRGSVVYDLWLLVSTIAALFYPKALVDRAFERLGRHHRAASWVLQGALALLAHALAVDVRYEGQVPAGEAVLLQRTLPLLIALRLAAFYAFGLHRSMWRYVGVPDVERIAGAVAVSSGLFWLVLEHGIGVTTYSRSIFVMDALLCVLLIGGIRFGRRIQSGLRKEVQLAQRVLVVSSGDAVEWMLQQIGREPDYQVIGIIDPDPRRRGLTIGGVAILGSLDQLSDVLMAKSPNAVVVEGGSVSNEARRDLLKVCSRLDTPISTVLGFRQSVAIQPAPTTVAASEIEQLLFRDAAPAEVTESSHQYTSRRILVTGAGGSIGSEICRQAAGCGPELLVLFENHEPSLVRLEQELRVAHPRLAIKALLGDVNQAARMAEVMEETRPQVVFHAAAVKHVPLMEQNAAEAYRTNLLGAKITAEAALLHDVDVFVLISTDKAVEPQNAVGLSKRGAELAIQALAGSGRTRFLSVRFGNVLESNGGVVPLFRQQIERGGPLTVTHPEATRLFIRLPEAVQLILEAGTMGRGGEVYVLDTGKPIRIVDMAHALIRMYGYTPGRDIEVVFIGLRPGERLFEKLVHDHETVWKTRHPRILMATNGAATPAGRDALRKLIQTLERRIQTRGSDGVREALARTGV